VTDRRDSIDAVPPSAVLGDLLSLIRRGIELDLRVAAPAHVIAYMPATQRVTVALGFLPVLFTRVPGATDIEVPQPPITIPDVPVQWGGGSLGYVTTPLVPGDTGLVLFTDRCLAAWRQTGVPSDPINGRTHALGDAVFLPGCRADLAPIVPPTSLVATVVEGPLVWLGAGATQPAVLGTAHAAALITFSEAISLAATTWAGVPGAPAVTFASAVEAACSVFTAAIPATLSAKVLVQ